MGRSKAIDIMKGICIILVVIGHYAPESAPHWYLSVIKGIYAFHMPLFMFLSGLLYCATLRPAESYAGFMRRKTLRLMVPYLFASVVIIGIKAATDAILPSDHPVVLSRDLPAILYSPSAAYFLWFLWALWLIFFIAAALRSVKARDCFLVVSFIVSLLPLHWPEIFCIRQAIEMAPYFAIGMSVYDHREILAPIKKAIEALPGVSVILFLGLYIVSLSITNPVIRAILQYSVALAGITAIASLSVIIARRAKARLILAISAASFAIYLFHTTFEGVTKGLLRLTPLKGESEWMFIVGAAIVVMAGVVFPLLLHRHIFSKNKVMSVLTATPVKTPVRHAAD